MFPNVRACARACGVHACMIACACACVRMRTYICLHVLCARDKVKNKGIFLFQTLFSQFFSCEILQEGFLYILHKSFIFFHD